MKVLLITGGSGGIGKASVLKFARGGYKVFFTTRDLKSQKVSAILSESDNENLDVKPLYLDLSKPETFKPAIDQLLSETNQIDVLVNNAASGYFSAVEDIDSASFLKQFEVNVLGTFQLIQQVLPQMRKQKKGKIINISSIMGFSTAPLNAPYSSSKYALESISETLALEVKPFGIDVVIVQPGDFHSDFLKNSTHEKFTEDSPYLKLYKRKESNINATSKAKRDPSVFAEQLYKIAQKERPRLRYIVGKEVFLKKTLHTVLGNYWIKFLRFIYSW